MRSRNWKKVMAFALASAMALSVSACGGSQGDSDKGTQGSNSGSGAEAKEFVYVPEFREMEGDNVSYYNMKYTGDSLYYESYYYDEATGEYSDDIVKYSLTDGSVSTLPLDLPENVSFGGYTIASDGSVYAICSDYSGDPGPEGYVEPKRMLCKFGTDGAMIFSRDLAEVLDQDAENTYIQYLALDSEDRVYLSADSKVFLLDAEGNPQGTVATNENWISGMGRGRDGRVYISYYDNSAEFGGYALAAIDPDKKAVGETYKDFMSGNGNGLYAGTEYDFLISDGTSVYAYDLESQKSEKLFDWLDSDINGAYATCVGQTEDGKILAVISDWTSNDNSVAVLTKTKASEVAQKETIVIGAMYSDSELQAAAVLFNKTNDKYRISIKTYVDYNNWSENTWSDALTNLNNDITSSSCPDIIDLNGLDIQRLAAKGLFEDLNPYLENSSNLDKNDFMDSVIEAYTYDGVLVSIPRSFSLQTVMGKASDLGDRDGWTIDEMVAYADAHPDAQLFNYTDKSSILSMCMMFNESAFIDWSTGECKFDTPEFKSLLEFVNRFPDEWQYEDGAASTPTRIQNGEILLDRSYISDFNEMQLYIEMFGGDVTCIGYPTTDGSCGTGMSAFQAYAITTRSDLKDGAWAFIENFLDSEENAGSERIYRGYGFPSNKEQLQAMAEEAVAVTYVTDENGEIMTDENGEPIAQSVGMGIGYEDGWTYDYRIPTQEEVDVILDLMDRARPISSSNGNDEIFNIINEEAAAYFQGQKTVDEVTNIIQSRINIYVSENS